MNDYTLDSDARRWWWVSAAVGTVAAAATAAILVLPATGSAAPTRTGPGPALAFPVDGGPAVGHPCFMFRANWNEALDGPQPVCGGPIGAEPDPGDSVSAGTVVRPWLDARP